MSGNYRRKDACKNIPKESDALSMMKRKYSDSLPLLVELFPDWNEEDLLSILSELNGDLELTVNRIADGRANQWTAAGKKVPTKTESAQRLPRPSKFNQKHRFAPAVQNIADGTQSTQLENPSLTWANVQPDTTPNVQNDLTWGTEETVQRIEDFLIVSEDNATSAHVAVEETTKVELSSNESSSCVIEASVAEAVLATQDDDDFVVRLPVMPARNHPVYEIEQPAVLLPFSAPIKSGSSISFGAVGGKIVFGQSKSSSPVSQKVYSPEELFASAQRSSLLPTQQPYATTSVDTSSGSPPGLVTPKTSYQQQQARDYEPPQDSQSSSSRRNHPPSTYYNQQQRQQFDVYGASSHQRYDQNSYSQRYAPYGASQNTPEDSYASQSYYNAARTPQGYYHHPHHYPAPQMMYGNDPYGATAFTAPPTRYQSGSNNFASGAGASQHSGSYNNYAAGPSQQTYQSQGGNPSNRRMF